MTCPILGPLLQVAASQTRKPLKLSPTLKSEPRFQPHHLFLTKSIYSANISCSHKQKSCGGVVAIISRDSVARGTLIVPKISGRSQVRVLPTIFAGETL